MAEKNKQILIVDDEENVRRLLLKVLSKEGYQVETAGNGQEALEKLNETRFDLVIMDIRMPIMDGMEAFHIIREKHPEVIVIMMTAFTSVDTAINAMKLGAYNYISKPFNISEVKLNINRALETRKLAEEVDELRQEIHGQFSINNIIGKSDRMQEVYKTIGMVAETDATVLISGESGTGKELVAKAIHYNSQRKKEPLVNVNCSALPEGMLESELFGHEKGAFTGAIEKKNGKFEFADGGTILLDEISEMSPKLQAKLLRVIQEKEFERVGGLKTIGVNVRIIAATNRNLEELIEAGNFREDLYYRLNVVPIHIPPLSDRKEDIPLLAEHFLYRCNEEMGRKFKYVSTDAMRLLNDYSWPGNVRELKNAIERAAVLGRDKILLPEHLPMKIQTFSTEKKMDVLNFEDKSLREIVQEVEKKAIKKALEQNGWNKTRTAKKLQMSRKALWYKIEEYKLKETSSV